jgi:hypothetical protein
VSSLVFLAGESAAPAAGTAPASPGSIDLVAMPGNDIRKEAENPRKKTALK